MQSTREIKRRIKSVNSTKQITRAMEMVSAAKLRKSQQRVESNRPYEERMRQSIHRILSQAKLVDHPLMRDPKQDLPTAHIIIAADRGLCGGYNVNVSKEAASKIGEQKEDTKIIAVGKYARDYFKKRDYQVVSEYVDIDDYPSFDRAKSIAEAVEQMFYDGVVGEVYLTFSEFKNAMVQTPVTRKVLPMSSELFGTGDESNDEAKASFETGEMAGLEDQIYKFEPSPGVVLGGLLSSYLKSSLFRALLEAKASEQGARMTAMKSATDNADDMIEDLTLTYNKARQGAITQEILEVVSGAQALE
ncbi:ATP synthase F1 subunit gamma [Natranaerobius trueperi]|uniref:ATP synthase gamma chain n=1 Tax=Natranaerobius trueperi TaxID=759412 RepID=A0A226C089_9FIRM|nr:ATP synthase F1 subunit gamma [Natranaerobius trueperi]OWZ84605.1 ATP synthase F1 subunit gamma [Natranaerobius trueperi]